MIKYFPRKTTGIGREGGRGRRDGGGGGGGNGENKNSRSRVRVSVTKQKFVNRIVFISLSVCWVT